MVLPAFRLHQMYAVAFSKDIEVIFSDLDAVNQSELKAYLDSKQEGRVHIVNQALTLDLKDRTMTIVGHKIRDNTWIIGEDRCGDILIFKHSLSNEDIYVAIQYIYHMLNTLRPGLKN
jgi:hypothetical protein